MREVIDRVLRFQCENAYPLPLNIRAMCRHLGIELMPIMDITRRSGLRSDEVYEIWGNRDGVLQRSGRRYVLSYNNYQPLHRQRFTMCEEMSHFLLGHLDDPAFQVFHQSYPEETYERCEREARFAAGMLLCPPRWYFRGEPPTAEEISAQCNVSLACARKVMECYERYGEQVKASPLYGFAPLNTLRGVRSMKR